MRVSCLPLYTLKIIDTLGRRFIFRSKDHMKSTGEEEMEDREKEKEREEEAEEEAYEGRNGESLQNYNIGRYDETSEIWVDSKMEA